MQREIKFRGFSTDFGWRYGDFTENRFDGFPCIWQDGYQYEVDIDTVGQYTGLNDKNGKEIYEADIVKFNNNDADLCQICFGEFPVYDMETEESIDTACGWYGKVIATDALSQIEPFCYDRVIDNQWIGTLDIEVIGNIYDDTKYLNQPQEDTK